MEAKAESLIRSLDADDIQRRLAELDAERRALMVLMRAARARERGQATHQEGDTDHSEQIEHIRIAQLRPSPENDDLYSPVDPSDPEVQALAASIAEIGVREPLVATMDGYLISGHRRFVAAQIAGLDDVPCRIEPFHRADDINRFLVLLREYNRQRVKTFDERLREELLTIDPNDAFEALQMQRRKRSEVELQPFKIHGKTKRARISAAKQPMLNAVLEIVEKWREFWPLNDRQIHYGLLNAPPLRHASKPKSYYANDRNSYKDLTDLVTRARLSGHIPMEAISDDTRPVILWNVYPEPGQFMRDQFDGFLTNYWRDLLQSQPNHIEVVAEKNTVAPICRPICSEYCVALTSGRGYCSLPPRFKMAERFRRSGKEKLILLVVSDFDPDGEEIAQSLARSLRDDFDIENIHPIKVALTGEQVERYNLPPLMTAKAGSKNRDKFVSRHGDHVWELEALEPEQLQGILRDAIDAVLDHETFEAERLAEREDARRIESVRRTVVSTLRQFPWQMEEGVGDD